MADDLTLVAGYPGSGLSWLTAALGMVLAGTPLPQAEAEALVPVLADRRQLDRVLGLATSDLADPDALTVHRSGLDTLLADLSDSMFADRAAGAVATHEAAAHRRHGMGDLTPVKRVIHLIRDPRDMVVEAAAASGRTVDVQADLLTDPDWIEPGTPTTLPQVIGDWANHTHGWVDRRGQPRLLVLFEDLAADPFAWLDQCLRFLALDRPRTLLLDVLDVLPPLTPHVQRWRTELDPTIARQLERDLDAMMIRMGYIPDPAEHEEDGVIRRRAGRPRRT